MQESAVTITGDTIQIPLALMQEVNEIRSLCSQVPLGWWDHLHPFRAVPDIPSHLLCPLATSFSLGSRCSCWAVSTVRQTASDAQETRENLCSLLLHQTSSRFASLSPLSHAKLISQVPGKSRYQDVPPCCVELQLPNTVPLSMAAWAKASLGGCSPSCSSLRLALNLFFF